MRKLERKRHRELVGRLGVIAAPAPDEEVPWYGDENRAMVDALRGLPPADATARLAAVFEGLLAGAGDEALLGLAGVADADTGVLTAPVRERLRAMLDAATAQGITGMAADLAGYALADWGFTPSQVTADVLLAYGADDERVTRPSASGTGTGCRRRSCSCGRGSGTSSWCRRGGGCWSTCSDQHGRSPQMRIRGYLSERGGRLARATLMQLRRS